MKSKIYKKITPHDSNSYLGYLNKLVYEYNNNYHHSIGKKAVDSDYSAFTEEIESNLKAPDLKLAIEPGLLSARILVAKVPPIIDQNK